MEVRELSVGDLWLVLAGYALESAALREAQDEQQDTWNTLMSKVPKHASS